MRSARDVTRSSLAVLGAVAGGFPDPPLRLLRRVDSSKLKSEFVKETLDTMVTRAARRSRATPC